MEVVRSIEEDKIVETINLNNHLMVNSNTQFLPRVKKFVVFRNKKSNFLKKKSSSKILLSND